MADPPELPGGWLPPQAPTRAPQQEPYQRPQPPVFVKERVPHGTNGLGLAATACAVVSLGLLVLTVGASFFLSLPIAIAGWVCASRANPDVNPGQVKTGQVLATVAIALSVLAMVVWVALILAGYTPEDLQRDLERELERQRQSS
jgi:hypothetical protein